MQYPPTESVLQLMHAATRPDADNTNLLILADALDESHPHGSDPRAMILRHAVSQPTPPKSSELHPYVSAYQDVYPVGGDPSKVGRFNLDTTLMRNGEGQPRFTLELLSAFEPEAKRHSFVIDPTVEDSRRIADGFPKAKAAEMHKLLDSWYGSRPSADRYAAAVVKASRV